MMDLQAYGYAPLAYELPGGTIPARIVEVHKALYKAVCAHGEVSAGLAGALLHRTEDRSGFPAVGDFVALRFNPSGQSAIAQVLPRKSKFSRTDFSGHAAGYVKTVLEQVVAANFDYVFILSSLNQDFNVNRIARYLTQARHSGGMPVVLLSKADLCESWQPQVESLRGVAEDAAILPVSSHTGLGLDALSAYMRPGKTIVFLGMSGVGKSSLLNALAGQPLMDVRDIREDDARGRHTTTHRQLFMLPSGAMVIDTPGMREIGLWDADEGIRSAFADVEALTRGCRFSDCAHDTEPGCAIRAALQDGTLAQGRWDAYLAQRREARFVARRSQKKRR